MKKFLILLLLSTTVLCACGDEEAPLYPDSGGVGANAHGPNVVMTIPEHRAIGVIGHPDIYVTFDTEMNPLTISASTVSVRYPIGEAGFATWPYSNPDPAATDNINTITVSSTDNKTFKFAVTPANRFLDSDACFALVVSTGAKAQSGNTPMAAPHVTCFCTDGGDGTCQ